MSSRLISGIAGFGHMLFGYEAEVGLVALFFLWNWLVLSAAPVAVRAFVPVFRRAVTNRNGEGNFQ
jgi:hypothetical protein